MAFENTLKQRVFFVGIYSSFLNNTSHGKQIKHVFNDFSFVLGTSLHLAVGIDNILMPSRLAQLMLVCDNSSTKSQHNVSVEHRYKGHISIKRLRTWVCTSVEGVINKTDCFLAIVYLLFLLQTHLTSRQPDKRKIFQVWK